MSQLSAYFTLSLGQFNAVCFVLYFFYSLCKRNIQCIKYKNGVDFRCLSPYSTTFSIAVSLPHGSLQLCCSRSIAEIHRLHLQCLLQRQREFSTPTAEETKCLQYWVRRRELNCKAYLFFWLTEDFLNILLKTCLSFDTLDGVFDTWRQSLSVLQTKWDVKAFPVPLFIYKPAQYCINKILELTKSWFWNHAYDFSPNNIHGRITQFWLVNINAVFR